MTTAYGPLLITRTMNMLRRDAVERRLGDLAIVYGWSAIRTGAEAMKEQADKLLQYRPPKQIPRP